MLFVLEKILFTNRIISCTRIILVYSYTFLNLLTKLDQRLVSNQLLLGNSLAAWRFKLFCSVDIGEEILSRDFRACLGKHWCSGRVVVQHNVSAIENGHMCGLLTCKFLGLVADCARGRLGSFYRFVGCGVGHFGDGAYCDCAFVYSGTKSARVVLIDC